MSKLPSGPKNESRRVSFNILDGIVSNELVGSLPPLYMQYNPQSWNHTFKKLVTRHSTIGGYVEEYWGEDLDVISASSVTGGFIFEEEGYTYMNRKSSIAYQKFQDILDIYKNNANTYDQSGRIIKKGNISLYFHPGTYLGYFESFSYTEDANNPFMFNFDFTFKVRKSITSY